MHTYITEIFDTAPKQYNLRNADFNIALLVQYTKENILYNTLGHIFGIN